MGIQKKNELKAFGAIDFGNLSFNICCTDLRHLCFIYFINLYFYEDWKVDLADSSICDYLWRLMLAFYQQLLISGLALCFTELAANNLVLNVESCSKIEK